MRSTSKPDRLIVPWRRGRPGGLRGSPRVTRLGQALRSRFAYRNRPRGEVSI